MDDIQKIMNTGVFADMGLNDMIGTKEEAVAEIKRLDAVNKKLVKALKFYANREHLVATSGRDGVGRYSALVTDLGDTAEAALQELNKV